jgi:hypothetical protein
LKSTIITKRHTDFHENPSSDVYIWMRGNADRRTDRQASACRCRYNIEEQAARHPFHLQMFLIFNCDYVGMQLPCYRQGNIIWVLH